MMQHRHAVTDFVWTAGRLVDSADLVGEIDLFSCPDPVALARGLRGQFALHQSAGHEHVLVRDPLGVNKLFFAIDARGDVVSSSYWIDLVRAGHPASAIWSVPSGRVLRVDPARRRLELTQYTALRFNPDPRSEPDAKDAARIRRALDATFSYRGRDYYRLPRMPAGQLRRFLVQGLDAGDREVGVFAHHGLDVIQPYALCAEAYAALPGGCVERPEAKQRLVREVMGDAIPSYIYERPKVRAQVGGAGEVRGTLAALVDRGIDSSSLERRFCKLFGLDPPQLRRAIRAGLYQCPTTSPDPMPSVHAS